MNVNQCCQVHFRLQIQAKTVCSCWCVWGPKGRQGLTFTVNHVGIEFEADLAETQEGAVGVDALAVEADVAFAALVHLCKDRHKRGSEGKYSELNDTFKWMTHWLVLNIPQLIQPNISTNDLYCSLETREHNRMSKENKKRSYLSLRSPPQVFRKKMQRSWLAVHCLVIAGLQRSCKVLVVKGVEDCGGQRGGGVITE